MLNVKAGRGGAVAELRYSGGVLMLCMRGGARAAVGPGELFIAGAVPGWGRAARQGSSGSSREDRGPGRCLPKNTYVREDQILPHLAAIAILLRDHALPNGRMQAAAPREVAALIDQLRTADITLTYDPGTRTLRTSDSSIAAVAVSGTR